MGLEDYNRWKELEQAINLSIAYIKEKKDQLSLLDTEQDTRIKQHDNAIRELQRIIESSK